jgi:hypothetical protein
MAGEEITIDNLRQLLSIQTELRELAELRWQKGQRALVSLLETFTPEEADRRLKSGQPLDSLSIDELEQLVRQHIGLRFNQLTSSARSKSKPNGPAAELKKMQEELANLGEENKKLGSRIEKLEDEKSGLYNQLVAMSQVVKSEITSDDPTTETGTRREGSPPSEPNWMDKWRRSESFNRDSQVLIMIGETGLSRRPLIESRAAEMLGIKKAGGSIQALLTRLTDLGLIELHRPWREEGAGTGGRLPDLVRLTDRGETAFSFITGKKVAICEYDLLLERHVTPEHTLLNLQAGDLLREAGYQVNMIPSDIKLPDGGVFQPDIFMCDDLGVIYYVEVEREANKDIEQRQAKWRNFYQASGGRLYVVCDNKSCMRSIRSEINYALGSQPALISLTNLSDLHSGKRGDGESIWLEVKKKGKYGNEI